MQKLKYWQCPNTNLLLRTLAQSWTLKIPLWDSQIRCLIGQACKCAIRAPKPDAAHKRIYKELREKGRKRKEKGEDRTRRGTSCALSDISILLKFVHPYIILLPGHQRSQSSFTSKETSEYVEWKREKQSSCSGREIMTSLNPCSVTLAWLTTRSLKERNLAQRKWWCHYKGTHFSLYWSHGASRKKKSFISCFSRICLNVIWSCVCIKATGRST